MARNGGQRRAGNARKFLKKLMLLVLVVTSWFAYVNRQRLFVRDPLGSVTRAGVREGGAQVYINYENDVLLENDRAPLYLTILQHGQAVGAPDAMKCIHYLLCLASGYPVPQTTALPGAQLETMTSQAVRFRDGNGREAVIALR